MDDTPGDVIDDGVVSAGTVKSLFQTGNVGLRVTCDVSWGLRLVVGRGVDREYKLVIAMDERTRMHMLPSIAAKTLNGSTPNGSKATLIRSLWAI